MDSVTPSTYDRSGPFGPRGLVLTGLSLHVAALLGLWQLAALQLVLMIAYFPFIFFALLLAIGVAGFMLCRLAWRCNSWCACGIHFGVTVLALAWVPALIANWSGSNQ